VNCTNDQNSRWNQSEN